jgi:hypothetical protein
MPERQIGIQKSTIINRPSKCHEEENKERDWSHAVQLFFIAGIVSMMELPGWYFILPSGYRISRKP